MQEKEYGPSLHHSKVAIEKEPFGSLETAVHQLTITCVIGCSERFKMINLVVGWLVGFYGILTFVGYLTPNPF